MSSLLKAVIGYCKSLGKRGELRNDDVLLAPKLSSSSRMLKFLSSRVLLCEPIKSSLRGDNRGQAIFELGKNKLISSPLEFFALQKIGGTVLKIGRSLDDCLRNRGMTVNKNWRNRGVTTNAVILGQQRVTRVSTCIKWTIGSSPRVTLREEYQWVTLFGLFLCLFLLFPFSSKAGIYFLPDAQNEEIPNTLSTPPVASIDSMRCEEVGYTYYSSGQCPAYHNQETCVFSDKYLKCDAEGWCRDNSYTISSCSSPKIVDTQCPNNFALYKYCVCPSTYKYACSGTGYSSGKGTVCESKYTKCNCSTNYVWSGSACVCDSAFKYSCSGTGYSSGSGTACGGKYKSCNCSTYYSWNGSACAHTHSYVCPSGYSTSSSGMISPVSTSKVCALSGCSSTSGTCYKEGHSHSYSCPSGSYASSSSCSYGTSGTTSKKCSCGATSSSKCYYCASAPAHTHNYTCPYSWYTFSDYSDPCRYGYSDVKDATCSSCGDILDDVCYNCYSICDIEPCTSGCYDDLDCSHGCASRNSCGGCDECVVPPCPETICTILGGTYSGGACSVDCSSRYCDRPCTCESQYGAELIDGYCTKTCGNVCIVAPGLD